MPKNERTQIILFQGDVDETKIRKLKQFNGAILVTGNATFKDGTLIPCGLVVLGDLIAEDLTILGSLLCGGECVTSNLTVRGEVSFEKEKSLAEIRMFKVAGKVTSKASINCITMRAGDDVEILANVYASEIIAAGKVVVEGDAVYSKIEARSCEVKGNRVQLTSYN